MVECACAVCGVSCSQRCTKCRAVFYCSLECQKCDWKRHRHLCGRPDKAWKELQKLVGSVSAREAEQVIAKVQDGIKQVQKQDQERLRNDSLSRKTRGIPRIGKEKSPPPSPRSIVPRCRSFTEEFLFPGNPLLFKVEEFKHLHRLQVLVWRMDSSRCVWENADVVWKEEEQSLSVTLEDSSVTIALPQRPLISPAKESFNSVDLVGSGNALSIRIAYEPGPIMNDSSAKSPIKPEELIVCDSCGLQLSKSVQDVCQLPSGRWQDMEDYLTCCGGANVAEQQLATMETDTMTHPRRVFWTDTHLLYHSDDLLEDRLMFVAPLENYGQGQKDQVAYWRDAATGGVTAVCSYCCAVVGAQTSDSGVRLYQHKLGATDGVSRGTTPLVTMGRFLALELLRYADVHAIFSLCVTNDTDERRLYVRLVSWSTRVLTNEKGRTLRNSSPWQKAVKIFFHLSSAAEVEQVSGTTNPLLFWQTTAEDWCCRDPTESVADRNTANGEMMTVEMKLSLLDWEDLIRELTASSKHQDLAVVEATILAKSGRLPKLNENEGLAMVLL